MTLATPVRIALTLTAAVAVGALLYTTDADVTGKAVGDPGDNPNATLDLLTADGGGASIAYRGMTPVCQKLSDFGVRGALDGLTLQGPGVGTALLRLYRDPNCRGATLDVEAAGDATSDTPGAAIGFEPRAFRVAVTERQELRQLHGNRDDFHGGDVLLDNGLMVLMSTGERFGLFRRDPATGALRPDRGPDQHQRRLRHAQRQVADQYGRVHRHRGRLRRGRQRRHGRGDLHRRSAGAELRQRHRLRR